MYRRANMVSGKGKRRIYSSKYALSSIVYCSKCGGREEWTKQGKGIRRVFRQSRIRNRKLWWRIGKETSG